MEYRKEIDGLRAIAVIVVMLFHAGFHFITGGFLGVDIFFVISGYLITSFIFINKANNSFSLLNFYERRARRLLPALFIVLLFCIPLAVMLMQPDDLQNFGQSLVSTSLMSNNILLFITSGYWDLASEFKPLLHTWSLGVEEQYYIFFPLLILLIWKFTNLQIIYVLSAITIISFIFSLQIHTKYPEADFYLLPSRLWQLGAGGILALFLLESKQHFENMKPAYKEVLSLLGFLFILLPIFFYLQGEAFSILNRFLVVLGTLIIIAFSDKNNFIGRLLSIKFLVFIGLMSYSLYLWHQPLYAFLRISSLSEPPNYLYLIMFLLSFFISFFSWKIEQIFRSANKVSTSKFSIIIISAAFISILSGLIFNQTYGFYRSYPELESKYSLELKPNEKNPDTAFLISAAQDLKSNYDQSLGEATKVMVVGDSFSSDFINMMKVNDALQGIDLIKPKYNCFNDTDIDENAKLAMLQSDFIVVAYRFLDLKSQLSCLKNKIDYLIYHKKQFVIIGTKDFGYNINAPLRQKLYSFRAQPSAKIKNFNKYLDTIAPANNFVDILSLLEDENGRIPLFTEGRKLISYDRAHLTYNGAKFVGHKILKHPNLEFFNYVNK